MSLSQDISAGMSIIIPSWSNLAYLKKTIESIRLHSRIRNHQIIVHVNEGGDGTLEWIEQQPDVEFTFSKENIGVCKAMNTAFKLATRPQTIYFNDDMIALPEWDLELFNFANVHEFGADEVWLSSTMIEPVGSNPCCVAPKNFGTDLQSFDEKGLLEALPAIRNKTKNVKGSTWPPCVISRNNWNCINGYSEEFSPGFGSDPDLVKKLYDKGMRDFIGVGRSLVYHFACKTTRVKNFIHNDGERTFHQKHGMSINDFVYLTLNRGTLWTKR